MAGIYGYEEDGFIALAIQPMAESGTELLSFRSSPNIDLTKMVKELFNGGGHPNACGARSDKPLTPHEYLQRISNYITNH
jgi:DHHA1 domain.